MARLRSEKDVRFLSFQGGGGLGFAYLGAIEALEALRVLPTGRGRQIGGVSGASAGAITAMLIALGCTSKELREIFSNRQQFTDFFDAPSNGVCRGLTPQDYAANLRLASHDPLVPQTYVTALKDLYAVIVALRTARDDVVKLAAPSSRFGSIIPAVLLTFLLGYGPTGAERAKMAAESGLPFLAKVLEKPENYLFNLTNDRGLFPGFPVRKFLGQVMRRFISRIPNWSGIAGVRDPALINFEAFKQLTGVDLVVSATNISQRRSLLFSAANTPEFPVAEAVGMSSCYPVVFKPVFVRAPQNDRVLGPLRGLWLDGGILNNFPIHAFDRPDTKASGSIKLNQNVLGFMLSEGDRDSRNDYVDPDGETSPLASLTGGLLATILVHGNKGQLRSYDEEQQTIPLFTFNLSLFDFSPSANVSDKPLKAARTSVLQYFNK
jgi:predicted acylesterase/phospholipase RssA